MGGGGGGGGLFLLNTGFASCHILMQYTDFYKCKKKIKFHWKKKMIFLLKT